MISLAKIGDPSTIFSMFDESKLMINGLLITKSLWWGLKTTLLGILVFQPIFNYYFKNTLSFNSALTSAR